jgi:hypothetical protein
VRESCGCMQCIDLRSMLHPRPCRSYKCGGPGDGLTACEAPGIRILYSPTMNGSRYRSVIVSYSYGSLLKESLPMTRADLSNSFEVSVPTLRICQLYMCMSKNDSAHMTGRVIGLFSPVCTQAKTFPKLLHVNIFASGKRRVEMA